MGFESTATSHVLGFSVWRMFYLATHLRSEPSSSTANALYAEPANRTIVRHFTHIAKASRIQVSSQNDKQGKSVIQQFYTLKQSRRVKFITLIETHVYPPSIK